MSDGLAILSVLQPEPPYATAAALGTTYSADLVACMVALTHLDSSAGDDHTYRKIEALRALERLRGKVLIAAQQGRISAPRKAAPALPLLDRILLPVAFDEQEHSFHPKVWVVRQTAKDLADRFVLLVGSRNLSLSTAWDHGMALVGSRAQPNSGRSKRLPEVARFVKHVCQLVGRRAFADQFDGLEQVFWQAPAGCSDVVFEFQSGTDDSSDDFRVHRMLRGTPERVLAISPFLDATMVEASAKAWSSATERLLVACPSDLDKVAVRHSDALASLNPRFIAGVPEFEPSDEDDAPRPLEERSDRGLHAKVTVLEADGRAALVTGSPNLTSRAWGGPNTEAYLAVLTDAETTKPLWDWATTRSREYVVPTQPSSPNDAQQQLDRLRNEIASRSFTLSEDDPRKARLATPERLRLETPSGEANLRVARLSTPLESTHWAPGASSVLMPPCARWERTAFVVFELEMPGAKSSWVQCVSLTPELDEERDREALVRVLGVRDFLRYLRSLLEDGVVSEGDDEEPTSEDGKRAAGAGSELLASDLLRLEDVLRRIAYGDSLSQSRGPLHEVRLAVQRYRGAIDRFDLTEADRALFQRLWATWDAIERGMTMP